jgi:predicted small metal-binding protein
MNRYPTKARVLIAICATATIAVADTRSAFVRTPSIDFDRSQEMRGDSEHDVLRKAAEHAKTAHPMDSIPPEVLSKVKGAIHDQGEPRTQKAGSSS